MAELSEKQRSSFLARAAELGHDHVTLSTKGEQYSIVKATSVEELRKLLGPPATADRKALAAATSAPAGSPREAAHRAVFAGGLLTSEHAEFVAKSLPLEVKAVSIENKTLQPGEVWDLGTSTSPVVINLGTLTMMKGSRIVIRNTALSFTCQKLIRES